MSDTKTPCALCPWRVANQGTRHPYGFFTRRNLTRLWNQIRKGGHAQSCHPTDHSHPDHGAKEGSRLQECAGAVIVVLRELIDLAGEDKDVSPEKVDAYFARRRHGLTKTGLQYWLIARMHFGGVPIIGEPKLPAVDVELEGIGLPFYLKEQAK